MIFRNSCVASYLLAMAAVSLVHCGETTTRHRKLSKSGDGGNGDDKKKQCGAQHVSGTYTNCYVCFMMFGATPTNIVPGCAQMVRGPPRYYFVFKNCCRFACCIPILHMQNHLILCLFFLCMESHPQWNNTKSQNP